MRLLLILLAFAAAAGAELETPFGSFARPGVPVLLRSSEAGAVSLEGWSYPLRAGMAELVSPPRLPCRLLDEAGRERARLEPVPEGALLVAAVGVPAERIASLLVGEGGARVIVIALEPGRMVEEWRPYDLFDLIVVAVHSDSFPGGLRVALGDWVLAGGELAVVGDRNHYFDPQGGLGRLRADRDLDRLLASLGPVRPGRIPRPGGERPDLYDLERPPAAAARPLREARALVAGSAAVLALLLSLGATGRIRGAALIGGTAVVLVSSLILGLLLPPEVYQPEAGGRIEVVYAGERMARWRTYHLLTGLNPSARLYRGEGWTPIFFRPGSPPWWEGAGGEGVLAPGTTRIFLEERLAPSPPLPERQPDAPPAPHALLHERPVLNLLVREAPAWGRYVAWGSRGVEAPSNERGSGPLLAHLQIVRFH
ncbi:MAG: hypothetical protein ACT4PV_02025 [Planctomycetaceae bacterium]